jgi:hypothetical protein
MAETKEDDCFRVQRHFTILTDRAVIHGPDVELLQEDHSAVHLPPGSTVFCLKFLQKKDDMVYAEIKDPPGWILAQTGDKKFVQLREHADDAEFTDTGGPSAEAPCSLAGDNFCFVGDIGSFFGFSSGVRSERQKQQNTLLKSFKEVKKEKV